MSSDDWLNVLWVINALVWFKLLADFGASLAPPPKRKKRGGRWSEDESRKP